MFYIFVICTVLYTINWVLFYFFVCFWSVCVLLICFRSKPVKSWTAQSAFNWPILWRLCFSCFVPLVVRLKKCILMRHFNFFSPLFSLCWLVSSIFTLQIRFVSLAWFRIDFIKSLMDKIPLYSIKNRLVSPTFAKICLNSFSFAVFKFFIHLLSFA